MFINDFFKTNESAGCNMTAEGRECAMHGLNECPGYKNLMQETEGVDSVTLDIPLMIRMLEYAREDAKDDMDLHNVTEKLIALGQQGGTLSMKDYETIVGKISEAFRKKRKVKEAGQTQTAFEITFDDGVTDTMYTKHDPSAQPTPSDVMMMIKKQHPGRKVKNIKKTGIAKISESLRDDEYYVYQVTFDDGTTTQIRSGDDWFDAKAYYAKRGKNVVKAERIGGIQGGNYVTPRRATGGDDQERQDRAMQAMRRYDQRLSENPEHYGLDEQGVAEGSEQKFKVSYEIHGSNKEKPLYTNTRTVTARSEKEAIDTIRKLVGGRNHRVEKVVDEAGPFSYGAKKPRKGSVADLAAKKRKEQEHGKKAIEPRDQMVGTARVVKNVKEAESVLPPEAIEIITKIAQSSASPEHKKAAIDSIVAKYLKPALSSDDAKELNEDIEQYIEELERAGYGIKEEKQRLDPKCWKGYRKAGTKMKGGVRVNNCVPVKKK